MTRICSVPLQSKRQQIGAINDSDLLRTTAEQEKTNRSYNKMELQRARTSCLPCKSKLSMTGIHSVPPQSKRQQIRASNDSDLLCTRHRKSRDNKMELQRAQTSCLPCEPELPRTAIHSVPPQSKRQQIGAVNDSGLLCTRHRKSRDNKMELQRARTSCLPCTTQKETEKRSYQLLGYALCQAPHSKRQQNI